ncbi:MAG TPA: thioredoxin domain-containing protein, partial [Candidatus Kapabacteria bacterium]
LLQHAANPVDWFPWGEEALGRARAEDRPIFLSIGYSACHWCHVMERESFESEQVAELLNRNFISIKVDREERPDIDDVYMRVLQAMAGSGGWPMSLFLTPDLKPIFAGTYFPPVPAHGRPSFAQLCVNVTEFWTSHRNQIVESSIEITSALQEQLQTNDSAIETLNNRSLYDAAFRYFAEAFDSLEGGFGAAPKFPRPVQLDFLFHYYATFGNEQAREIALFTLRKMALGGMHDHLGGGFHRYSVDRFWRVSHFEKMLYDQAQLTHSYLDAWQISQDPFFRDVVKDILDYVLRDMTHASGGFFSAEDADSEGEEGKFYAWTYEEIQHALGEDAGAFARYYGITKEGNFEHGKNVLHATSAESITATAEGRKRLFVIREQRIRPLRDDKVLTSWNGLMIGAMARAGDVLNEARFLNAAIKAGEFIWNALRLSEQLLHRWRQGDASIGAFLEDYAFLTKGFLDLYEATFDPVWIHRAVELQSQQDSLFYDEANGGYFSAQEAPDLILRTKSDYDGAEPSPNSIAVLNLQRLAVLTENNSYSDLAKKSLDYFLRKIGNYPYAMPEMLCAGIWKLKGPSQLIFAGETIAKLKSAVNETFQPLLTKIKAEMAVGTFALSLSSKDHKTAAYFCRNGECQLPVTEPAELTSLLNSLRD